MCSNWRVNKKKGRAFLDPTPFLEEERICSNIFCVFVEPSPVLSVESNEHSYLEKCSSDICRTPGNIKNRASRNAVILDRCMSNFFLLLTPV